MRAADLCYRNVRWKRRAQAFMSRQLTECRRLQVEVLGGTYRPTPTQQFRIVERGKPRTIRPVDFRDRVVQRCLCDNALTPAILAYASEDCSACLPGRGLDYATERVRGYVEGCPYDGWAFQFDLHDYFHTIDRQLLDTLIRRLVQDEGLRWLARVTTTTGERGLELGSHVSQLLACAYAVPIDRAVSAVPRVVGYHRYMDDGIVLCRDRESSIVVRGAFADSCGMLGLTPNPRKTHLNRLSQPLIFCKTRFTKLPDGSVRTDLPKRQTRHAVAHAARVVGLAHREPGLGIDTRQVKASLEGYLARSDVDLTRLVGRIDWKD